MATSYIKKTLKFLALTGSVYLALSSPTASRRLFKNLGIELKKRKDREYFFWTLSYLRRKKYIRYTYDNNTVQIELTEDGRTKILKNDFNQLVFPRPKYWDKKWRIIAFDIPERKRRGRDELRRKLKQLGCVQLQKSMWVWPYECQDEVDFIAELFDIGKYVHYIVADSVTSEKFLLHKFELF